MKNLAFLNLHFLDLSVLVLKMLTSILLYQTRRCVIIYLFTYISVALVYEPKYSIKCICGDLFQFQFIRNKIIIDTEDLHMFKILFWIKETMTSMPTSIQPTTLAPAPIDPCTPDPCGQFAQCRRRNNIATCSCLQAKILQYKEMTLRSIEKK